ncbi:MAG: (deoxy)nucleoside triphosphate pyrophosphohydrolase [Acidobacteria bacterium]|nr:(deoxy)nucleoside triphosphate pyrophosphohydrolase [Acidobacteriota bacterium]
MPLLVLAAVVERDDSFLLTRRLKGTHLAGMWEFPGGKCEAGETHEACLQRELMEELGVDAVIGDVVFEIIHAYPEKTVELHFRACTLAGEPVPQIGQEMRWVPRAELKALKFPEADRELIELLTTGTR